MGWNRKKVSDVGIIAGGQMDPDHMTYISTFWTTWAARDQNGLPKNDITAAIGAAATAAPNASLGMQLYGAIDLVIDY